MLLFCCTVFFPPLFFLHHFCWFVFFLCFILQLALCIGFDFWFCVFVRFLFNCFLYFFSILFPRFWIIFTIITLNFFSGRLPISSSFVWSGGFLPCSLINCVFLCLLILLNLLCLGSPFCRMHVSSSHCFWSLAPVGKVVSLVV